MGRLNTLIRLNIILFMYDGELRFKSYNKTNGKFKLFIQSYELTTKQKKIKTKNRCVI